MTDEQDFRIEIQAMQQLCKFKEAHDMNFFQSLC